MTQTQQNLLRYGKTGIALTSEYEKHRKFLGKPLPGLVEIAGRLKKEHVYLLENYGAWMEALVKNEIRPLTNAQRKFIQVAIGNLNGCTRFEKAWINSLIVKNSNQKDMITSDTMLHERFSNVGSFSNSETIHKENSESGGGIGFITGIVLAVLAFSIVPVIPVIIAFFAGHWLNYNFGENKKGY